MKSGKENRERWEKSVGFMAWVSKHDRKRACEKERLQNVFKIIERETQNNEKVL